MAIRRHWELVCCAFSFCWHNWHNNLAEVVEAESEVELEAENSSEPNQTEDKPVERGGNQADIAGMWGKGVSVVARSTEEGEIVAKAMGNAVALLERVVETCPATPTAAIA